MNRMISKIVLSVFLATSLAYPADKCDSVEGAKHNKIGTYLINFANDCPRGDLFENAKSYNADKDKRDIKLPPYTPESYSIQWRLLRKNFLEGMVNFTPELNATAQIVKERLDLAVEATEKLDAKKHDSSLPNSWQLDGTELIWFNSDDRDLLDIGKVAIQSCKAEANASGDACLKTLQSSKTLLATINLAKRLGRGKNVQDINKYYLEVKKNNQEWDNYIYNSKPMFFTDFFFTDWICGVDHQYYKKSLIEPPEYQLFILHPSVAMEYIDNAKGGDKFKPAVTIELLGINAWRDKLIPLGLFDITGISATAIYSDRFDVPDVGFGPMFTIENKYSIGVSWHKDFVGVFVNIDLADYYRESLGEYVNKIRN